MTKPGGEGIPSAEKTDVPMMKSRKGTIVTPNSAKNRKTKVMLIRKLVLRFRKLASVATFETMSVFCSFLALMKRIAYSINGRKLPIALVIVIVTILEDWQR